MTKLWGLRWWMMGLLMWGRSSTTSREHAGGRGADRPERPRHHDAAVLVDPQRLSVRHHAAAAVRLRHGHGGAEARVRDLRDRVVVHQHGARSGGELADALRPARAARLRGRIRESGRHEGDVRVVSRRPSAGSPAASSTWARRWVDARRAARRVGDSDAQLAVRVRAHRRRSVSSGPPSGCCSTIAVEAQRALAAERDYILSGQERHLAGEGGRRCGPSSASGISGASPCRGFSPIRRGAR